MSQSHPTRKSLSDFVQGRLEEVQLEQVSEHLDQCTDCQRTLDELAKAKDTLLGQVREAGAAVRQQAGIDATRTWTPAADMLESIDGLPAAGKTGLEIRPITWERLHKILTELELVSHQELEALRKRLNLSKPAELGANALRELTNQGKLTSYQARAIYQDRSHSLRYGEYTVLDRLGAGGMGQVFKAVHRRMRRVVALKVLSPSALKNPEAVRRFEREATAAAKLNHPAIVTAYDFNSHGSTTFFVMEFIEGRDLSKVIQTDGQLPVTEAIDYILQVARALEFAHQHGIVHRDIKPANLLLDKKGRVKILDLGLAKFGAGESESSQTQLTMTAQVMGTVDYMAPEQALNTKRADARSDIYSLGCTLYRLLTNEPVYYGETITERFLNHRESPIPSLRAKRPEVPQPLDELFTYMLAKQPERRPETMAEVVKALEYIVYNPSQSLTLLLPRCAMPPAAPMPTQERAVQETEFTKAIASLSVAPTRRRGAKKKTISDSSNQRYRWLFVVSGTSLSLIVFFLWLIIRGRGDHNVIGGNGVGEVIEREVTSELSTYPPWQTQPENPDGRPSPNSRPEVAVPLPAKSPFSATQAQTHQKEWATYLGVSIESLNDLGMTMVVIPPGEYLMGTDEEQFQKSVALVNSSTTNEHWRNWEAGHFPCEMPAHRVKFSRPFQMSATEVTVAEFREFIEDSKYVTQAEKFGSGNSHAGSLSDDTPQKHRGLNWRIPGAGSTDTSPVSQVTWHDAIAFCNWLSDREKLPRAYTADDLKGWSLDLTKIGYRLPTEAEWEYACRAGSTTQYWFGDEASNLSTYAWTFVNKPDELGEVRTKPANPFGLYDMYGNVEELCTDWHLRNFYEAPGLTDPIAEASKEQKLRVARGGNTANEGRSLASYRSAFRGYRDEFYRDRLVGFRVARTMPTKYSIASDGKSIADAVPPIARFTFDLPANLANDQVNSFSGTNYGANSIVDMERGNVLQLTEKTLVDLPVKLTQDMTISFWVQTTKIGGISSNWERAAPIVSVANEFRAVIVGNSLGVWSRGYNSVLDTSKPLINDNAWHHVAVVRRYANQLIAVYIDGMEAKRQIGWQEADAPAGTMLLGRNELGDLGFDGLLDELRIYDKVLSVPEIQSLAKTGTQVNN